MLTNTTNTNNNKKRNFHTVFFLFACLFFISFNGYSQNLNTDVESTCIKESNCAITAQNQIVSLESQLDFVGWFMGSKQTQNLYINKDNATPTTSNKKQLLSSGISPNRVLYRTFMKKVISQDNAIV